MPYTAHLSMGTRCVVARCWSPLSHPGPYMTRMGWHTRLGMHHAGAGVVDDGPHCALVMKYYKGGTVSALIAKPEYYEVPLSYRLKLALQVRG